MVLVSLLLLSVTVLADEPATLDTDSPSSSEHSVRTWPGLGLRVGWSGGLVSGYWLYPGATSVSSDFAAVVPIGHRFSVSAVVQRATIHNDAEDVVRLPVDSASISDDLWRWMLTVTGYGNSHLYQPGSWTPYVTLGAGIARHGNSKFAAQFGGGNLIMFRDGIGLDLGVNFTCVLNGWGKTYADRELAAIFELRSALVLRVL